MAKTKTTLKHKYEKPSLKKTKKHSHTYKPPTKPTKPNKRTKRTRRTKLKRNPKHKHKKTMKGGGNGKESAWSRLKEKGKAAVGAAGAFAFRTGTAAAAAGPAAAETDAGAAGTAAAEKVAAEKAAAAAAGKAEAVGKKKFTENEIIDITVDILVKILENYEKNDPKKLINFNKINTNVILNSFFVLVEQKYKNIQKQIIFNEIIADKMFNKNKNIKPETIADVNNIISRDVNNIISIYYKIIKPENKDQIKDILAKYLIKINDYKEQLTLSKATPAAAQASQQTVSSKGKGKASPQTVSKGKRKGNIIGIESEIETKMLDLLHIITQDPNPNDKYISDYLNMLTDNLPTKKENLKEYYDTFIKPFIKKLNNSKYEITKEDDKDKINNLRTNFKDEGIKTDNLDKFFEKMFEKEYNPRISLEITLINEIKQKYKEIINDTTNELKKKILTELTIKIDEGINKSETPLQQYLSDLIKDYNGNTNTQEKDFIILLIFEVYDRLYYIQTNTDIMSETKNILIEYSENNFNKDEKFIKELKQHPGLVLEILNTNTTLDEWAISPTYQFPTAFE